MMRLIALALMLGLLAACTPGPPSSSRADARAADPERGRLLAWQAGCGACHVIPGVRGADGAVGPPLAHVAARTYIAGVLLDTGSALEDWIREPQRVKPGDAMPDLGLSERDAADIAAYLRTRE
jgi:cytochrome c